jgi:type II secretory pathway pseudopilin PulG
MKPLSKTGFTIIEVILFIGISGALIVGILMGTGNSINTQRYHDSVYSFRTFLQQQYSDVLNIGNSNLSNDCNSASMPRGQSDCVIMGKYITTSDSKKFNVKSVIGTIPSSPSLPDEIAEIKNYNIKISSTANTDLYEMEWGSSISDTSGASKVLSMLVLRSPVSGTTKTFISEVNPPFPDVDISSLLTTAALTTSANNCINSGDIFTGGRMSVVVNKNSSNANAIVTFGDDSGC